MNIKETWSKLSNQKKNIMYWVGVILFINLMLALPQIWQFLQTGHCRDFMTIGSQTQSCTTAQFVKNGHAWLSFTNLFLLIPAAAIMMSASKIIDVVFAKKK